MKASAGSKSFTNLAASRRDYPTDADAYELLEECGRGVSATVWMARCKPYDEIVAVKHMDLEAVNCSLDDIVREAQTMRLLHHPNVLPLHVSFVHKQTLWMVEPYIAGGSMLNIMKYAYPEGLEEPVIAAILRDVLKGLDYMHKNGNIHRDVKAGNILVNTDGSVLLADFGVAATLERDGSWGQQVGGRNTFVGTPCWMAPEVMEQAQGYNALADIWSFGITVLELAHGHAPFARFPPMKVLLMTIQNPPPTLEQDSGKKHFSKYMRDVVAKCLVKDPAKRPTAAQLLDHKFFKTHDKTAPLVKQLLAGLPPVTKRVAEMRAGKNPGSTQAQAEMEHSQAEYVKGVSNWNFDVAALKASAAAEGPGLAPVPEGALVTDEEALNGVPITAQPPAEGEQAAGAAMAPASKSLAKKQGRFEILTEEPADSVRASSAPGTPLQKPLATSESLDAVKEPVGRTLSMASLEGSETGVAAQPAAQAKRKGRFNIVAEEAGEGAKGRVGRSTSLATLGDSGKHPVQPATVLLPALRDCLEGMTAQQEMMKQLVSALGEVERGKQAGLSNFINEYASRIAGRPSKEDHARVKSELAQVKEENSRLRDRLRQAEEANAPRRPPREGEVGSPPSDTL